jgi:cytidine deaminase
MEWRFKAVRIVDGKPEWVDLSPEQKKKVPIYTQALIQAGKSEVPDPVFSGYYVKGGIGTDCLALCAGNIEYGLCQALHCEESAVAAIRSVRNENGVRPVLGFSAKGEVEKVPTCCGNCRDILLDVFGPKMELISGDPAGGVASVASLDMLLFDGFKQIFSPQKDEERNVITAKEFAAEIGKDLQCFAYDVGQAIKIGKSLENDVYSPGNVFSDRKYFVLIHATGGNYIGALDLMCDYHPIYPIRDAVRQAFRARDFSVKYVVIVGQQNSPGTPPHVMYKDRQHLLEFNLCGELVSEEEINPTVYLVTHENGNVVAVWKTSVKEWLPFPFTPEAFMDLEEMGKYYQAKVGGTSRPIHPAFA